MPMYTLIEYSSSHFETTDRLIEKSKLKLKWKNHCTLSANGNKKDDANSNDIIFTKRHKNFCVCSRIISRRQLKTIKTS